MIRFPKVGYWSSYRKKVGAGPGQKEELLSRSTPNDGSDEGPRASLPAEEPYPSPIRAWCVVTVLMVIYVFSFIDRTILNLLVGPIEADSYITDTQM